MRALGGMSLVWEICRLRRIVETGGIGCCLGKGRVRGSLLLLLLLLLPRLVGLGFIFYRETAKLGGRDLGFGRVACSGKGWKAGGAMRGHVCVGRIAGTVWRRGRLVGVVGWRG